MRKLVGFSGPQGGGKTTLLNGLKDQGFHVDDFKVSRAVQAALGWNTLEYAYEAPDTMMEFQDAIMAEKLKHDCELLGIEDDSIVLTERTFADIAIYTQIWTSKLLMAGKWEVEPAVLYNVKTLEKAHRHQVIYSGNVILPFMRHMPWDFDPNRAKQDDIQLFEELLFEFIDAWMPEEIQIFTVTEASVEERVRTTAEFISSLKQTG